MDIPDEDHNTTGYVSDVDERDEIKQKGFGAERRTG